MSQFDRDRVESPRPSSGVPIDGDFVTIGKPQLQPPSKVVQRVAEIEYADPSPLGLFGYSMSVFLLSCRNAGCFGGLDSPPNYVLGLGLAYGGFAQFVVGMWFIKLGSTFNATVFASYGCFWLSYAVILIPSFGVEDAFEDHHKEFQYATGFFLFAWAFFTFSMWMATLKSNIAMSATFFFSFVTLGVLSIAAFTESAALTKLGGYLGILVAASAWYLGLALLWTEENSYITLPVGQISSYSKHTKLSWSWSMSSSI